MDLKGWITGRFYDVRNFFKYSIIGRIKYGFDLRDLWSLDHSISKYVYPRLKRFVDSKPMGYPSLLDDKEFIKNNNLEQYFAVPSTDESNFETWIAILKKMEKAFKLILDSNFKSNSSENEKDINEGLRLFAIFFQSLWD